jgi:hypothetical protein
VEPEAPVEPDAPVEEVLRPVEPVVRTPVVAVPVVVVRRPVVERRPEVTTPVVPVVEAATHSSRSKM